MLNCHLTRSYETCNYISVYISIYITIYFKMSNWGKNKKQYYSTDYVDKDFPSITKKDEKLADCEEEEAIRLQGQLLSKIVDVNINSVVVLDDDEDDNFILQTTREKNETSDSTKKVRFDLVPEAEDAEKAIGSEDEDEDEEYEDDEEMNEEEDDEETMSISGEEDNGKDIEQKPQTRERRPISKEIKHNRGLTPYKKKKFRNPRVKHKNKFQKAMSTRRRTIREHMSEYHRYSGESRGINPHSVKSVKL